MWFALWHEQVCARGMGLCRTHINIRNIYKLRPAEKLVIPGSRIGNSRAAQRGAYFGNAP